jgi:hypothetical protein
MNISMLKIMMLTGVFSAKIAASEATSATPVVASYSSRACTFLADVIRKRSCIGACKEEEDEEALKKVRGAECLCCLGASCFGGGAYGTLACAKPTCAYACGTLSGIGLGTIMTMLTNNNDRCSIVGQHTSSTTREAERTRILSVMPELQRMIRVSSATVMPTVLTMDTPLPTNSTPVASPSARHLK